MDPLHSLEDLRTQAITCIALNCVPIIPLVGLCIITTSHLVKTRHEPQPSETRVAFITSCVALYLQLLYQFLLPPIYIITLPTTLPSTPLARTIPLLKAAAHLSSAANLVSLLAQALLFAALAFLPRKSRAPSWDAALSLASLGLATAIGALAFAGLGKQMRYVEVFWDRWFARQDVGWISGAGHDMMVEAMRVVGAADVVVWVGVVGVVVGVVWKVRNEGSRERKAKTVSLYSLAACLVWLLPATWRLVYQLCWTLREDYDSRVVPLYAEYLKSILGLWPMVVVFGLLYQCRKKIWTANVRLQLEESSSGFRDDVKAEKGQSWKVQ